MSHVSGAVKFEDGAIMYCEYDGTADFMCSRLYLTREEMHENWRKDNNAQCDCGGDEPIRLMDTYGGGKNWNGRACRKCKAITEGTDVYFQCLEDGPTEAEEKTLDRQDGEPDWSPYKTKLEP